MFASIEQGGREYLALIVPPLNPLQEATGAKPAEPVRTAALAADLESAQPEAGR